MREYWQGGWRESGLKTTNRFSPGYCGWHVSEQHNLFRLVPDNYCGITLNDIADEPDQIDQRDHWARQGGEDEALYVQLLRCSELYLQEEGGVKKAQGRGAQGKKVML
ncbi:MAG: hypothetical protein MZV64_05325 [Ignavibacteriales bacterium]|nr:hypothetical protein [Ignavibacteriales bacterium]